MKEKKTVTPRWHDGVRKRVKVIYSLPFDHSFSFETKSHVRQIMCHPDKRLDSGQGVRWVGREVL